MHRGVFAGVSLVLLAIAACGEDGGAASGDDSGAEAGVGGARSGAAGTGAGAVSGGGGVSGTGLGGEGGAPSPYANVVAVSVSGDAENYLFAVTIESADIDCSQYADFWEVLDEEGTLLYRRILEHSHTDANGSTDPDAPGNTFTRSGGPVPVTADDVVIVRAHMNVGGYNGVARRGSAATEFVEAPDIDSDFAAGVEDEPPLPAGCLF
jgi:hypothetical protein